MVVEVGLGGTWDCTNVVHGDVAVLTNVSFDHTDVLGPTLEGIAADKAGIIEPGSRVVVGEMAPDLVDIVDGPGRGGRRAVGVGGRARLRLRVQPGGRRGPGRDPVDARRPLRGRPGAPARGPSGRQRRRSRWRRWRPSSATPSTPDVVEEGFAVGARAGSPRGAGPAPAAARRRRAQRGGHGRTGRRVDGGVHGRRRRPSRWWGCCRVATPRPCSRRWRRSGVAAVIACEPTSPRAMPVAAVSEAGRALGLSVYEEPDVSRRVARGARHGRRGRSRGRGRVALRRGHRPGRRAGRVRALGGRRSLTRLSRTGASGRRRVV